MTSVLPELLSEVQVDGNRCPCLLGCLHGLKGAVGAALADSRRDSCDMEPVGIGHDRIEVEIGRLGLCNAAVCPVIDHKTRSLVSTGLQEVDSNPSAVDHVDAAHIDTVLSDLRKST